MSTDLNGKMILVAAQTDEESPTFHFFRGRGVRQGLDFYVLDNKGGGVFVPSRSLATARDVTTEASRVLRYILEDELLTGVEVLICITPDPFDDTPQWATAVLPKRGKRRKSR